jgi:hypothetical protein
MTYEEFEAAAHRMWAGIPPEYKEGIDGVVVKEEAETHGEHDDYYTLGMCYTEPYPSGYMGPETTRSFLALYYGSFLAIADRSPEFSWEEELWETITHELRHHLEFLAEDDALEGLDYALEETYKRGEGEVFDPWYYQSGLPLAPDIYRVEYDVYIEQVWRPEKWERADRIEFDWDGRRWSVDRPAELGDLHYLWVGGVPTGGGSVQLVLVRHESLWGRLKRLLGKVPLDLLESEGDARVIGSAPGSPAADEGRPGRAAGGPPLAVGDREEGGREEEGRADDDRADDDREEGAEGVAFS